MSEALGVQIIPDNRAGGGTIGVQAVAKALLLGLSATYGATSRSTVAAREF